MITPVKRESLADRVVQHVQHLIRKGGLQPGDRLPSEIELARQFEVGRSTVREAKRELAMRGLIEVRSGNGTCVAPDARSRLDARPALSMNTEGLTVLQVVEGRRLLETRLAELAAQRAGADDVRRIERALHGMEQTTGDCEAFIEADLVFHRAVARAAHNLLLLEMYRAVQGLLRDTLHQVLAAYGSAERTLSYHVDIYRAINAADPALARSAAERHLDDVEDRTSAYLLRCAVPDAAQVPTQPKSHQGD